MNNELVPIERIERRIFLIRGQKVMIDKDLAELYGVPTKVLNRATMRNNDRFPVDFMFQLTKDEFEALRCQIGTSNLKSQIATSNLISQIAMSSRGGRRYLPYAFTEQGIAMLSSVLRSKRAVQVNIAIMRAFVMFRQMIANNQELAKKIELLEKRVFKHDANICELVRDIRKLTIEKGSRTGKIGFLQ
jgi:ORF6N domain